ncbi:hypothetical protein TUM12370_19030 [Salmonella enterica subsp. enterica serovar Choleraesuis]|nr:hypothetical protein TUM12370_19030 [Salmonella enterica subsp. enterica serovar Choleraesuis]
MKECAELFRRRKPERQKLLNYGFSLEKDNYVFHTGLVGQQFILTVSVAPDGKVYTSVTDSATGEDYVLHRIAAATGAFVGAVRDDYLQTLSQIAETCFSREVFKQPATKHVISFIKQKYGHELEFLWPRFPDNAIFRRQDTAKWYGAILTVKGSKIGLENDSLVEILDVRMGPDDVVRLVDGKKYFPGYHMNKKHWVTMLLDGSVPEDEIFMRIENSYALALK